MPSKITAKNERCIATLNNMPGMFTLADFRAKLGLTDFGPDWAAAAATLQAFKRAGLIRRIPGANAWEKTSAIAGL